MLLVSEPARIRNKNRLGKRSLFSAEPPRKPTWGTSLMILRPPQRLSKTLRLSTCEQCRSSWDDVGGHVWHTRSFLSLSQVERSRRTKSCREPNHGHRRPHDKKVDPREDLFGKDSKDRFNYLFDYSFFLDEIGSLARRSYNSCLAEMEHSTHQSSQA